MIGTLKIQYVWALKGLSKSAQGGLQVSILHPILKVCQNPPCNPYLVTLSSHGRAKTESRSPGLKPYKLDQPQSPIAFAQKLNPDRRD